MTDRPLAGRVALVTGANRGIGLAVAGELGRLGARVLVGARDAARAEEAAASLRREGLDARALTIDVVDPASVDGAAREVGATEGRLDVLVNNAGVLEAGRALEPDAATIARALDVNLLGPWRTTAAFAPLLRRSRHGRVVNVSSGGGSITELPEKVSPGGGGSYAPYRVSKAALNALTRLQALELQPDGVLVNAACPGWVRTDMGGASATRSPAEGASSVVGLVLLSDDGPTGGFFRDTKPVPW